MFALETTEIRNVILDSNVARHAEVLNTCGEAEGCYLRIFKLCNINGHYLYLRKPVDRFWDCLSDLPIAQITEDDVIINQVTKETAHLRFIQKGSFILNDLPLPNDILHFYSVFVGLANGLAQIGDKFYLLSRIDYEIDKNSMVKRKPGLVPWYVVREIVEYRILENIDWNRVQVQDII